MKIGLIAGSGQFPLIFSKKAKSKGFAVCAVAYLNEADPGLAEHVDSIEWVHLGQIGRVIRFFRNHGVSEAVMMGAIRKTRMFSDVKPDMKAISLITDILHTHDDNILRAFARVLEKEGIVIRESTFLLPDLLAPKGCWTRRKPSRSENSDIALGWKLAKELGKSDIGQCVVVAGGSVLAVEAIDGTDETIIRGGKLSKGTAVAVKVCKPAQDFRFDIPAVGVQTIDTMHRSGVKVLAVEAGKTVVFDREEMIALADRLGISVTALGDGKNEQHETRVRGQESKQERQISPAPCSLPKIRVGVVGVGYLGKFHAEKYAQMPDVELAGVADTDFSKAEEVAERLGTKAYQNYQELIGKADAVSIVVPTKYHFGVSKDFLENNTDVMIEKPMTVSLEEADALIRLAESKGLIVQVGHLERFNPAVIALRDIIKKPMFIESHRLSLYKDRGTDVSVVLDLMIHDIDIILNFVRSEIKHIHASGVSVVSSHVDIANARLEFENGCVANVTASRISMKNERKLRMFQKDAYISVDFSSREITAVRMRAAELHHTETIVIPDTEQIPGMDISRMFFTQGDALENELKSFVNAVRKRETSEVTGQMGRDALKIALNIIDQIKAEYAHLSF